MHVDTIGPLIRFLECTTKGSFTTPVSDCSNSCSQASGGGSSKTWVCSFLSLLGNIQLCDNCGWVQFFADCFFVATVRECFLRQFIWDA
jgi:hypothetical protein